jgi:hypothetical protein
MADLGRDLWIRETGTGQQVAQLHDRYMMMMMTSRYYYITSFWSTQLTVLYDTDGTVHFLSVGCYKVLMSALRNRIVPTLDNGHIMTTRLEL